MKKVLVKVDEALWARVRARALESKKSVPEVVEWAFRMYLASKTEPVIENVSTVQYSKVEESAGFQGPTVLETLRRPTAAEIAALVNTVKPGSVTTGRRLTTTAPGDESGSQVRDDDDFNTF